MPTKKRDPRVANGYRRRAVRARVLREETVCHLCGDEVDTTLPPRLPGSPEVDEIIPVSKGGSPLNRTNCRLAHRACNLDRSNMDLTEYLERKEALSRSLTPAASPRVTHRQWWD